MVGARAVTRVAGTAEDHPALEIGARVGYAVGGVLHLLIGWIALQVAWSGSGRSADQSGALQTLAGNTLGRLTLWVAVLGFVALGLWQLANGFAGRSGSGSSLWANRAKSLSKAIVYLALAWTCFNFAKGRPSSSKAQSTDFTATLLQQSGGRVLVAVVGLVVIGVGGYHVVKAGPRSSSRISPGILAPLLPAREWSATWPRVWPWSLLGCYLSLRRRRTQQTRPRGSTGHCALCVNSQPGPGF